MSDILDFTQAASNEPFNLKGANYKLVDFNWGDFTFGLALAQDFGEGRLDATMRLSFIEMNSMINNGLVTGLPREEHQLTATIMGVKASGCPVPIN